MMAVSMGDLFESPLPTPKLADPSMPLAARMRPRSLEEVVGQDHLIAPGEILFKQIQADELRPVILYGPPGTGKTTLAKIISEKTKFHFIAINAVTSNVAELRKVVRQAQDLRQRRGTRTVLFIDEIHRFSKSQQDVLMPFVENGLLTLIGATTHNPSFVLNAPLLSRSSVYELYALKPEGLINILTRALKDPVQGLGNRKIEIHPGALQAVAKEAQGDARRALNILELAVLTTPQDSGVVSVSLDTVKSCCQKAVVYYDHDEDGHYDTISAFIKSMRGSDPDAAIYWMAKMLYAGEDPRFLIRRMLIFASEDIGNADPQALILASAALNAVEFVGMPESRIILSQLAAYLSLAPKSNASCTAISQALSDVEKGVLLEVPDSLKDQSYPTPKKKAAPPYRYPHTDASAKTSEFPHPKGQVYTPVPVSYYHPKSSGFEKVLLERLQKRQS